MKGLFISLITFLAIPNVIHGTEKASIQNEVYIFTQTFCPSCLHAKKYMQEHNIKYIELDIEQDPQALKAFERINGRGTPLIVINKKMMYGFSPEFIHKNLYD